MPATCRADVEALLRAKKLDLVLQAGGLSLVALDLADAPVHALRRIPMTTWLQLQKTLGVSLSQP